MPIGAASERGERVVTAKGGKRVSIKSVRREDSASPSDGSGDFKAEDSEAPQKNTGSVLDCYTDLSTVRSVFLQSLSVIYFSAFLSIYLQIEGLYGTNGVTPAKAELELTKKSPEQCIRDKLSLLCILAPRAGLSIQHSMELLAILGVLISATASMCSHCCLLIPMAVQWVLYFSIYQVGGTFMWFQWESLLLETGFLAILIAPWFPTKSFQAGQPRDIMTLNLVKWLLFRLMFSSGVVKLQSGCPTWWGLTALNYHFESQCLPTPLSYHTHQFPQWILRLMVVGTYFVEIVAPFAILLPFRILQRFSFWLQMLFQISIILTGNYNYFNFLTIVLCVSLLDADFFTKKAKNDSHVITRFLKRSVSFSAIGAAVYYTVIYFDLKLTSENTISSSVAFTRAEFDKFISYAVPASIAMGVCNLVIVVAKALTIPIFELSGCWKKFSSFLSSVFYGILCIAMFALSVVPYSTLHRETGASLLPELKEMYGAANKFHLVSSYGLFRRMTGTDGGRPEVILEFADSEAGPWQELHFLYKPGNVTASPLFIVPHQPRLDWQMWFAALQTYHESPWFISLTFRLLRGEPSVQKLLDTTRNPSKAPKFIRAFLYHYTFTKSSSSNGNIWSRTRTQEYMPAFHADHKTLIEFIRNLGYMDSDLPPKSKINESLTSVMDSIRVYFQGYRPELIIWTGLATIFALQFTSKLFKSK